MPDNQKNPVIIGNQMLSKAKSCQAHTKKLKVDILTDVGLFLLQKI